MSSGPSNNCPVDGCGKTGTKTCSSCKLVKYCSKEHQKEHWKAHKKLCKQTQKQKAAAEARKKDPPQLQPVSAAPAPQMEVLWVDQQKINVFGRLNYHLSELNDEIKECKNTIANLNDVKQEIEDLLEFDDGTCKIKVGDLYVDVSNDEAEEHAEEQLKVHEEKLAGLMKRKVDIKDEMTVLKRALYAKFGDTINLDANTE